MGRTIESATQTWVEEEKALKRFVRALRKSDQELVQELLALSRHHIAEASYASNLYPMDIYLVSMLLELFKKVRRLESHLEELGVNTADVSDRAHEIPRLPSLVDLVRPVEAEKQDSEAKSTTGIEYVDFHGEA
jgi:predicted dehydrogenase